MKPDLLKNKQINTDKLLKFGFKRKSDFFEFKTELLDDFLLTVIVKEPDIIQTKLEDIDTNELYTLHLTEANGDFVGKIRAEYNKILEKIAEECFESNIFKLEYSKKIIEYIKAKYDDEVEYLWEKTPDNAIARRKDNSKWYLAILTVKKDRLGFDTEDKVEIINLRANPDEIQDLIQKTNIYKGYHMNKKHWISIILDGSMDIKEIFDRIDVSYNLADKNRK